MFEGGGKRCCPDNRWTCSPRSHVTGFGIYGSEIDNLREPPWARTKLVPSYPLHRSAIKPKKYVFVQVTYIMTVLLAIETILASFMIILCRCYV